MNINQLFSALLNAPSTFDYYHVTIHPPHRSFCQWKSKIWSSSPSDGWTTLRLSWSYRSSYCSWSASPPKDQPSIISHILRWCHYGKHWIVHCSPKPPRYPGNQSCKCRSSTGADGQGPSQLTTTERVRHAKKPESAITSRPKPLSQPGSFQRFWRGLLRSRRRSAFLLAILLLASRLNVNSGWMDGSSLAADVDQYMMEQVLEGYASPALMMHDTKSHGRNRLISGVLRLRRWRMGINIDWISFVVWRRMEVR